MYTFKVRRRNFRCETLAECSDVFSRERDRLVRSGIGGSSKIGAPLLYKDGQQIGYISYNGRIWKGTMQVINFDDDTTYTPPKLLYDNRELPK